MNTTLSPLEAVLVARLDLMDARLAAIQALLLEKGDTAPFPPPQHPGAAAPAATPQPAAYSVEEVAERLGLSAYTVRQRCHAGLITAEKRAPRGGGRIAWWITPTELDRLLRREPPADAQEKA